MAVVVFSKPVAFPVGLLRQLLTRYLPLYRWQIGEEDHGTADELGRFRDHDIVTGRSASTVIFTEMRCHQRVFEAPAPDHVWHLQLGEPTTELEPVADRIVILTCLAAMSLDGALAHCQLRPGGNWLSGDDMKRLVQLVLGGEGLDVADGLGIPPGRLGSVGTPAPGGSSEGAPALRSGGADPVHRMLSPMVLMCDRPLVPDWAQIETFARALDPEGEWTHVPAPDGAVLSGRGTRIFVTDKAEPVPAYVYEDAFGRSFWYKGDRAAIAAHRRHVSIGSPLDTAQADWVTIRQTAKVVTLITGLLARLPGSVAVHTLGVGIIFEPQMVGGFLSILGNDQLPVQLWSYSAWHSLVEGDVSVSTSGLMPFLGHEIEAWNAPLSAEAVQTAMSDLIIYLLDKGPVIGHGDTAGRAVGDKAIRCFLGPSRAQREAPVQSLCLEFREQQVDAPRADMPAARPVAAIEAARTADAMIDDALASVMESASPGMRKILGDIRAGRGGGAPAPQPASPAAPAPTPAMARGPSTPPPAAPAMPPRRSGGFGRKGL